jgi:hypothetical protein
MLIIFPKKRNKVFRAPTCSDLNYSLTWSYLFSRTHFLFNAISSRVPVEMAAALEHKRKNGGSSAPISSPPAVWYVSSSITRTSVLDLPSNLDASFWTELA